MLGFISASFCPIWGNLFETHFEIGWFVQMDTVSTWEHGFRFVCTLHSHDIFLIFLLFPMFVFGSFGIDCWMHFGQLLDLLLSLGGSTSDQNDIENWFENWHRKGRDFREPDIPTTTPGPPSPPPASPPPPQSILSHLPVRPNQIKVLIWYYDIRVGNKYGLVKKVSDGWKGTQLLSHAGVGGFIISCREEMQQNITNNDVIIYANSLEIHAKST